MNYDSIWDKLESDLSRFKDLEKSAKDERNAVHAFHFNGMTSYIKILLRYKKLEVYGN